MREQTVNITVRLDKPETIGYNINVAGPCVQAFGTPRDASDLIPEDKEPLRNRAVSEFTITQVN